VKLLWSAKIDLVRRFPGEELTRVVDSEVAYGDPVVPILAALIAEIS
jgi:hypothetical protein